MFSMEYGRVELLYIVERGRDGAKLSMGCYNSIVALLKSIRQVVKQSSTKRMFLLRQMRLGSIRELRELHFQATVYGILFCL